MRATSSMTACRAGRLAWMSPMTAIRMARILRGAAAAAMARWHDHRSAEPPTLSSLRFRGAPSLFPLGYSDRRLRLLAGAGALLSFLLLVGVPQAAQLP